MDNWRLQACELSCQFAMHVDMHLYQNSMRHICSLLRVTFWRACVDDCNECSVILAGQETAPDAVCIHPARSRGSWFFWLLAIVLLLQNQYNPVWLSNISFVLAANFMCCISPLFSLPNGWSVRYLVDNASELHPCDPLWSVREESKDWRWLFCGRITVWLKMKLQAYICMSDCVCSRCLSILGLIFSV